MGLLSDEDRRALARAKSATARTPIPVQMVSSDEFWPWAQSDDQRLVHARLVDLAD
jgi:hypothetical protein